MTFANFFNKHLANPKSVALISFLLGIVSLIIFVIKNLYMYKVTL